MTEMAGMPIYGKALHNLFDMQLVQVSQHAF